MSVYYMPANDTSPPTCRPCSELPFGTVVMGSLAIGALITSSLFAFFACRPSEKSRGDSRALIRPSSLLDMAVDESPTHGLVRLRNAVTAIRSSVHSRALHAVQIYTLAHKAKILLGCLQIITLAVRAYEMHLPLEAASLLEFVEAAITLGASYVLRTMPLECFALGGYLSRLQGWSFAPMAFVTLVAVAGGCRRRVEAIRHRCASTSSSTQLSRSKRLRCSHVMNLAMQAPTSALMSPSCAALLNTSTRAAGRSLHSRWARRPPRARASSAPHRRRRGELPGGSHCRCGGRRAKGRWRGVAHARRSWLVRVLEGRRRGSR